MGRTTRRLSLSADDSSSRKRISLSFFFATANPTHLHGPGALCAPGFRLYGVLPPEPDSDTKLCVLTNSQSIFVGYGLDVT